MSTIRLRDVTKIFPRPSALERLGSSRGLSGDQVDRAFAERAAWAALERDSLAGHEGPITALDRVNLTIPDGQTFTVVGPSGCGKSTLLRVVAGLESDFTGDVFYDDENMRDVPPKDRYIGMVFQNYALYPHFTSRGNLSFFFWVRKAPDEETEERIRVTSEIMGIGFNDLLRRRPGTLSGGEQQRVAIGRAIVRNPRLFLFDEPLSNLDAKLRAQTRIEIKRLLRRFQITSIYVTHDQAEAIVLADQMAVMRAGRIEQVGPYQQLRREPANAFVAGFLGNPPMNLLAAGVVSDGELRLGQFVVPLPDAVRGHVLAGQRVTLGVRPEAARVVPRDRSSIETPRPLPGGPHLRGTVEVIEPDFAHRTQLVYARTGSHSYAATDVLDPSLSVGDEVEVVFPADQLYFFDAESERRLG
jgi:ABC-type sugar transport system ATPase subunit